MKIAWMKYRSVNCCQMLRVFQSILINNKVYIEHSEHYCNKNIKQIQFILFDWTWVISANVNLLKCKYCSTCSVRIQFGNKFNVSSVTKNIKRKLDIGADICSINRWICLSRTHTYFYLQITYWLKNTMNIFE